MLCLHIITPNKKIFYKLGNHKNSNDMVTNVSMTWGFQSDLFDNL